MAAALRAPRTLLGYASDWRAFTAWCGQANLTALPASVETVSNYLLDLLRRGRKVTTATRHASGIAHQHRTHGHPSPCGLDVRQLLLGAQRLRGEQPHQKAAISLADLREMCGALGSGPRAVRNRAILLVGFATALRRSNLVALDLADVAIGDHGLVVGVRREKQDQLGRGRQIGVPPGRSRKTCPIRALRAWLEVRGNQPGPLFCGCGSGRPSGKRLHGNRIAKIVHEAARAIGLDPKLYGGHSLRAGFITAAGEAGAGELLIAAHTGHRCMSVLRQYFRHTDLFRSNACAMLGL